MNSRWVAGICMLCMMMSHGAAQEVVHQRTVIVHQRTGFWRGVQRLLFGSEETAVFHPFDVLVLADGRFLVTDIQQNSLLLLDKDGALIRRVSRVGPVPLGTPVSIALDESGQVFLADSSRMGILRLTPDLRKAVLVAAVPNTRISGIALAGDDLFAVDTKHHCVRCLDKHTGREQFRFGERGDGAGQFNYPTDIAVMNGRLYVLDTLNFRVQVFDLKGRFQSAFGSPGDGGGHFARPKSLALHPDGLVFVSDVAFDNIQLFDAEGRLLAVVGGHGQKDGTFWMPSGVCLGPHGQMAVSDTYNHRIQLFAIRRRGE